MIAVVDTEAGLAALEPEWDALWQRSPDSTPFQSPRWQLPWWRQFGTGMPRVAIERRDGALVGLLPLYVLPEERKALPIGAGTSDYLDALGDPTRLLPAVLARLQADSVDSCDLIEVPPGAQLLQLGSGWHASSRCPVLPLGALPPKIARNLRTARNRAERAGGCAIEQADAQSWPDFLQDLVRLHQSCWEARGEPGVLASPPVLAFWRDAGPRLLDSGLLQAARLRVGPTVAASILALLSPGRIYFYLSGFDDALSFVSPGAILLGAMLDGALAEGRREAHLLRGAEGYKYAWGGVDRLNSGRSIAVQR